MAGNGPNRECRIWREQRSDSAERTCNYHSVHDEELEILFVALRRDAYALGRLLSAAEGIASGVFAISEI